MTTYSEEEQAYEETTWVNGTHDTVKFRLMTDKRTGPKNSGIHFRIVTLHPGDKITLSSEFNSAIRTEDTNGIIVGGLCPFLNKEGEEEVNLHPCLDFKKVVEDIELDALAKKMQKDNSMKDAIKAYSEKKVEKQLGRPKKETL